MGEQIEFIELLKLCDIVLKDLFENKDMSSVLEILGKNNIKYDSKLIDRINEKLDDDGYAEVTYMSGNSSIINISSRGKDFIHLGGYILQLQKEKSKEMLESELKSSTINSNRTNINFHKWNIGFAVLNLIILIINLIIGYFNLIKPGH